MQGLRVIRAEGKLGALDQKVSGLDTASSLCGIGHTRWATHGLPVERNAHPHMDDRERFALVHNGIIENYAQLKAELMAEGHTFLSETDTEVLVHLIAKGVDLTGDVRRGISWALSRVDGAYAFALLSREHPGRIWACRKASPLLLGVGTGENFLASDIPAFLPYTRDVVFLDNGELVEMDSGSWKVFDASTLAPLDKAVKHISWDVQAAQKDGFKHFMLKEISYIHSEGYAAGEMKHGPIALIGPHFPTFAMALGDEFLLKVASNLQEVQARGGSIIALVNPGAAPVVQDSWDLPTVWGLLNSFLVLPAVQLFAYEMAVNLGKDVDQPWNLAKNVTVE
jgi:glucosamine 6-phosphate synthetase-like amidotransferase/phosphosugar isomerase protein